MFLRLITSVLALMVLMMVITSGNDLAWLVLVSILLWFSFTEWGAFVRFNPIESKFFAAFGVFSFYSVHSKLEAIEYIPTILSISVFFWVCLVPFILKGGLKSLIQEKYLCAFIGWCVLLAAAIAMSYMKLVSVSLLVSVLLITIIADVFAYVFGKLFGSKKLAEHISPGKTWAGVYGAILSVLAFNLFIVLYGPVVFQFSEFDKTWHMLVFKAWPLPIFIIWSIVMVVVGIMGDLFESMLKRQAHIKDSGKMLPGHGGILDRIDAHIAVLPMAALLAWVPIPA